MNTPKMGLPSVSREAVHKAIRVALDMHDMKMAHVIHWDEAAKVAADVAISMLGGKVDREALARIAMRGIEPCSCGAGSGVPCGACCKTADRIIDAAFGRSRAISKTGVVVAEGDYTHSRGIVTSRTPDDPAALLVTLHRPTFALEWLAGKHVRVIVEEVE